jgi:hypothetical protein
LVRRSQGVCRRSEYQDLLTRLAQALHKPLFESAYKLVTWVRHDIGESFGFEPLSSLDCPVDGRDTSWMRGMGFRKPDDATWLSSLLRIQYDKPAERHNIYRYYDVKKAEAERLKAQPTRDQQDALRPAEKPGEADAAPAGSQSGIPYLASQHTRSAPPPGASQETYTEVVRLQLADQWDLTADVKNLQELVLSDFRKHRVDLCKVVRVLSSVDSWPGNDGFAFRFIGQLLTLRVGVALGT